MKLNQETAGYALIGFSVILILILGFVKSDIDKQSAFLCQAVSEDPDLEMEQCPAHQSNTSWLLVLAFGVAFVILAGGIFLVFMPLKQEGAKVDISKLDEEEKKIHELLSQNQGSMYQSDLMKELAVSKVKLTRILDKMENKAVVERKRRGMTNIVVLK